MVVKTTGCGYHPTPQPQCSMAWSSIWMVDTAWYLLPIFILPVSSHSCSSSIQPIISSLSI